MCCDSWGRKESDTTSTELNSTEAFILLRCYTCERAKEGENCIGRYSDFSAVVKHSGLQEIPKQILPIRGILHEEVMVPVSLSCTVEQPRAT